MSYYEEYHGFPATVSIDCIGFILFMMYTSMASIVVIGDKPSCGMSNAFIDYRSDFVIVCTLNGVN